MKDRRFIGMNCSGSFVPDVQLHLNSVGLQHGIQRLNEAQIDIGLHGIFGVVRIRDRIVC
jgi:hypothetical protein